MTRRIYLAGGSSEAVLVACYVAKVRQLGYEVTSDWTEQVLSNRAKGGTDATLSDEEQKRAITQDLTAVQEADIFWLLMPRRPSFGAGFEFAWSFYSRTDFILASGSHVRASIFTAHAKKFDTHDDALAWLAKGRSWL